MSTPQKKRDSTFSTFTGGSIGDEDRTRVDRTAVQPKSSLDDAFEARTVVASKHTSEVDSTQPGFQKPTMSVAPPVAKPVMQQAEATPDISLYDEQSVVKKKSVPNHLIYAVVGLAAVLFVLFMMDGEETKAPVEKAEPAVVQKRAPEPTRLPSSQAVLEQFEQSYGKTQGQVRPDPSR